MLANIIVLDSDVREPQDSNAFVITIAYQNSTLNIMQAVKDACADFIKTPRGQKAYRAFGKKITWTTFLTAVPNDICKNHGFEKFNMDDSDIIVSADDLLV